jgi:hypothetical protein
MALARGTERPIVISAEVGAFERKSHPLRRIVEIRERGVKARHAAQIGVLLARIGTQQKKLCRAEIVKRPQVRIAGRDRAAQPLRNSRTLFDALRGGQPFAIPAFAVADLDTLGNAVTLVKIGAAELRDVHDPGRKMIRPALVAGKIAKHRHAGLFSLRADACSPAQLLRLEVHGFEQL